MSCEFDSKCITKEELIAVCEDLKQGNIKDKYETVKKIRGAITLRKDLPIDTIIEENVIPILVEGLKCNGMKVQFECAWVLSNIASGNEDQTKEVMYAGVLPIFQSQLETTKDKDYIQIAIWCLGNLCGEKTCRNIILSSKVVPFILGLLNKYLLNQDIMESCVFFLRNAFCEMDFSPAFRKQQFRTILNLYMRIMEAKQLEVHTGVISDILQFCQACIENNDKSIGMLILNVVNQCLTNISNSVQASLHDQLDQANNYPTKQIIEIIGNILAENDIYAATLIQQGLLDLLQGIYVDKNNDDQLLRLEVIFCWMNISGGRNSQTLYDYGVFPVVLKNVTELTVNADDICYEAARRSMVVICNFICECSDMTRLYLLENNIKGVLEGYLSIVQGRWKDEDHDFVVDMLQRING